MTARSFKVDDEGLPTNWPTHQLVSEFWEELGRVIATYGFLEETLGKAIFALTGTKQHETVSQEDFEKWIKMLQKAVRDPLGGLIAKFEEVFSRDPDNRFDNPADLVSDLKKAKIHRDVLCHGSWRKDSSDSTGRPFFVNKNDELFDGAYSVNDLRDIRKFVVALILDVVNSVSLKGYQFPGSSGPGQRILS